MSLEAFIIIILVIVLIVVMSGHIYIIHTQTTNKSIPSPPNNFSSCHGDPYGCCPNTQVPKLNMIGSNCRP